MLSPSSSTEAENVSSKQTVTRDVVIDGKYGIQLTTQANKNHDPRYADLHVTFSLQPGAGSSTAPSFAIVSTELEKEFICCYVERTSTTAKNDNEVIEKELNFDFSFLSSKKGVGQIIPLGLKNHKFSETNQNDTNKGYQHAIRLDSYGKAAGKNFVSLILLPFRVSVRDLSNQKSTSAHIVIGLRLIKTFISGGKGTRKQAMVTLENIVMFGPSITRQAFLESSKKRKKDTGSSSSSSSKKKDTSSSEPKKRKKESSRESSSVEEQPPVVVVVPEDEVMTVQLAEAILPFQAQSSQSSQSSPSIPQTRKIPLILPPENATSPQLNDILQSNRALINEETNDADKLKMYWENLIKEKGKNSINVMCRDHFQRIEEIVKKIDEGVVVSFFAKPGYGKSYMINLLVSDFASEDCPLPSGQYLLGRGMTSTVVDIMYDEYYSLTKEMCTVQEYNTRLKNLDDQHKSKYDRFSYDRPIESSEIDSETNMRLTGHEDSKRLPFILERAKKMIEKFEKEKTTLETLTVKKLILRIPSEFLKISRVVLRDMPGYDEINEGELFKQYIRESFVDTSLILCGIENSRNILDGGIVRKLWEYGVHQPNQKIRPSVAVLSNIQRIDDNAYNELLENTGVKELMRMSFKHQLALHFDVLLEGVQISPKDTVNATPIEFDDKIDFVKNLDDNFEVTFFPNQTCATGLFIENLRYIFERNRRKLIDYNIGLIRDMAIIILSNIKVPRVNKIPKQFTNVFNDIRNKLLRLLEENLELAISYVPDPDYLYGRDLPSLINGLVLFYESQIALLFDKKDLSERLQKAGNIYLKVLRLETKKQDWINHFKIFTENFEQHYEAFNLYHSHIANDLKQSLINNCIQYNYQIDKSFVHELVKILDVDDDSKVDDFLEMISSGLIDYHNKVREFFAAMKESLREISDGMDKNVKALFHKYKKKSPKDMLAPIELSSKYTDPCRLLEGMSIPRYESNNVKDVAEKHYCAPNDKMIGFGLAKRDIETFVIKKEAVHLGNDNEISLRFGENKELLLSYNQEVVDWVLNPIKKLTGDGLKPVFIMTRPRGKNYKLQTFVSDLRVAKKAGNLHHMFIIVTERKYVERYKKSIEANEGNIMDYFFLILESDIPLGPGRVHTSILAVANFLHIETIHIVHDDIRQFYEYSYDHKAYIPHETSMLRALTFMEKVLRYELFNPQKEEERKRALHKVLFEEIPEDILQKVIEIMKESEEDEEDIQNVEEGKIGILQVLRILVENLPKKSRQKYTDIITSISNPESKNAALSTLANNPQEFLGTLQELSNIHDIKTAAMMSQMIENEFNDKKHIGRISLWNNQSKQELKNRIHNLNRPTHLVTYVTSSVHTYYMPSMEGIYPISVDNFWTELDNPNDNDEDKKKKNSSRKSTLMAIRDSVKKIKKKQSKPSIFKTDKKKAKAKIIQTLKKPALERGWAYCDIGEKTQMLLHGVGGFQVFNFGYAPASVPSLVDYTTRKTTPEYDSDEELVEELTQEEQEQLNTEDKEEILSDMNDYEQE